MVKRGGVQVCLNKGLSSLSSPRRVGSVSQLIRVLTRGVQGRIHVQVVNSCSISNIASSRLFLVTLQHIKTGISIIVPRQVRSKCKLDLRLLRRTGRSNISAVLAYSGNVTTVSRVT